MTELNDKLISYGNLSTFYDKLQEQGLGGNAIEEVSELPNASENKDKLFRLDNGDKDVYAAKLLSSETTTTNRLPDAQQIDKAYLFNETEGSYYYKGTYKMICSDGEIDGYLWEGKLSGQYYYVFTKDNAVDANENTDFVNIDELSDFVIDSVNKTITTTDNVTSVEGLIMILDDYPYVPIPATYNAPEANQIGNASIKADADDYVYTNETVVDNNVTYYLWKFEPTDSNGVVSTKQASEIFFYYNEDDSIYYTDVKFYWYDGSDIDFSNEAVLESLYIPQLNASDSEQVNNAYIYIDGESEEKLYYKGAVEGHFTDGNLTVYRWTNEDGDLIYFSKYPATQQYQNKDNSGLVSVFNGGQDVLIELYWDSEKDGWYSNFYTVAEAEENISQNYAEILDVNLYVVKYQRTEVTEVWGWEKVATEQYVDDAIDNIEFPEYVAGEGIAIDSANTISCTVKPITNVSVLPDAEANKDSVLRLEGDKKLYVAKYNPHNAPESEQIDNAYILINVSPTIYKGVHTFTCTNGNLDMYIWGDMDDYLWATLQPASEIDSTTAYIINQDTLEDEFGYEGGDNINATISEVESVRKIEYQVYPIKYNYTYTWQRVVTEDELDGIGDAFQALEARIYALEHPTTVE